MRTVSNFLCVCILTRSHIGFLVGSAGSRRRSRGAVQQQTEKSWSGAAADGEVVERSVSVSMESNRSLRKVCPQCDTTLHVKRAVCGCWHAFPSKRKAQCIAKKEAMKRRRTLESEQDKLARRAQDRICKEGMRASETLEQTFTRQKKDRLHKETKRALETHEQIMLRQELDRLHKISKKVSETPQQTLHR